MEPAKPAPKVEGPRTWNGFLNHVHEISPATGHNLEQGNIISEPKKIGETLAVKLGFPKSAKVFYEYLSQQEVRTKILAELSVYYEVSLDKLELEFDLKGQEEEFHSVANIKDMKLEEAIKEKEKNMLDNQHLKMAESLFNTKVDKVIVNKKQ
ncbi:MAG: hypothetical protein CME70_07240 [Halobacteriovorax sp.]|nr:hypothetical protein [Halobacteriovorax sp.]